MSKAQIIVGGIQDAFGGSSGVSLSSGVSTGYYPASLPGHVFSFDDPAEGSQAAWPQKALTAATAAVQADAGKQPTLVTVGGKPGLQFDGVDDQMTFSIPGESPTFAWWVVLRQNAVGVYGAIIGNLYAVPNVTIWFFLNTYVGGYIGGNGAIAGDTSSAQNLPHGFELGHVIILLITYSSPELRVYQNNVLVLSTDAHPGLKMSTDFSMGAAAGFGFMSGVIFETHGYTQVPSDAQRLAFHDHLRARHP